MYERYHRKLLSLIVLKNRTSSGSNNNNKNNVIHNFSHELRCSKAMVTW